MMVGGWAAIALEHPCSVPVHQNALSFINPKYDLWIYKKYKDTLGHRCLCVLRRALWK
jgi:hypothetical protein